MHTIAEFSDLCNQFEQTVKNTYYLGDDTPFHFIENKKEFKVFKDELKIIHSLRNHLAHEPHIINKGIMTEK